MFIVYIKMYSCHLGVIIFADLQRNLGFPSHALNIMPVPLLFSSRLALYVYEYLLHVGAQKSAQTFLSEVRLRSHTHTHTHTHTLVSLV